MGDFAGAVLKYVRRHPVDRLTICGGFAKLSKLAAGHLDLHSARSQVNKHFLAELAREGGATESLAAEVEEANTGLEALQPCAAAGVPLGDLVAARARDEALGVLRGAPVVVDVICIDRAGTVVGRTSRLGRDVTRRPRSDAGAPPLPRARGCDSTGCPTGARGNCATKRPRSAANRTSRLAASEERGPGGSTRSTPRSGAGP